MIVDSDTMEFEAIQNDAAAASGGAGVRAAQTVVSKGVESVITGSVGPNALPALKDSGVNVFTGIFGTVREAIEGYKEGGLQTIDQPGPSQKGMGYGLGPATGAGAGMGRGGGFGGRGGGYGRGGGRGRRRGGGWNQ